MNQTLPPRFREKAFRRYETTIAKALNHYPASIEITSQAMGLSLCTIENRLRDAITSHATHHWPSNLVDWEAFKRNENNFKVSARQDSIIVSFYDAPDAPSAPEPPLFRLGIQGIQPNVIVPEAYLDAVAFLAQAGVLSRPVYCKTNAERILTLEGSFDVATELQPDGSYKLI